MAGSVPLLATAPYMKTKIITLATGLTMENARNITGSAQLDSICQPSQAAGRKERLIVSSMLAPPIRESAFGHGFTDHQVEPIASGNDEKNGQNQKSDDFDRDRDKAQGRPTGKGELAHGV